MTLAAILCIAATNSLADCPACTTSRKVQIQLKSGGTKTGYLAWNTFAFEDLIEGYGLRQQPAAKAILKDWDGLEPEAGFSRWVEAVNLVARNSIPIQSSDYKLEFTLYRKLVQIEHPRRFLAVEEGDVLRIRIPEVAGISLSAKHQAALDTTGIPVLSRGDIALLKKEPRFWIEQEGSVGATITVVYGKDISLTDVLEHIMSVSGDARGSVSVNGVRIMGRGDFAPPDRGKFLAGLGEPLRSECEAFLRKEGSYEPKSWSAMKTEASGRIPGVVQFSYSWD